MPSTASTAYTVATTGFESACKINTLPKAHRASRLHGHGFLVKARAVLPDGWARFAGSETDDLHSALCRRANQLDHRYLNEIIANPTNENIARWVREGLAIELDKIAVQSTPSEGVDIDRFGNAHIWHLFSFEAAHQLPNVEPGHQCGRMHGHGFKVILHANQQLQEADMGIDLDSLVALWDKVAPELEFSCLNDIPGLENPTSEHLCQWLWQHLKPELEALSYVSVYETATAGCHFDGINFRIWKDFRFESALTLEASPDGEVRRRMHGHSYLVRLHIKAPLDEVFGWTIDYGDVKARFKPLLAQLDHHTLNNVHGMDIPSSAGVTQWIERSLAGQLKELDRVDCYERPGCGTVLSWSDQGPSLPI